MTDTSNLSLWLALIAGASIVQTLLLLAAVFAAWRATRQARQMIERFERQQIDPLMVRVQEAIGEVRAVAVRAQAIDHDVREKVANATGHAKDVAGHVMSSMWPAFAIGRAAYAAVSSFRRGAGRPASS